MIKILRTIWVGLCLLVGVLLAASGMSAFMLILAFPWGAILAVTGSKYWSNVWLGFDCFCNAVLGGTYRETISSRLGKSTLHGFKPVFGHIWIDRLVSWWLHSIDRYHVQKSVDWDVGDRL